MEPPPVSIQAPQSGGVDLQRMLLLGLLSKKLPVPYAVVKPRQQKEIKSVEENAAEKSDEKEEQCQSPPVQICGIKRKQSEVDYDTERKEKRKKMNRVSAQNSRDKKKRYVEELEKRLKSLEVKNKQLAQENMKLREQSSVLEAEKRELARRLAGSAPYGAEQAPSSRKEEGPQEWFGSAVPTVSLQQKRTPVSLLQLWTTVSLFEGLASPEPFSPLNCGPASLSPSPSLSPAATVPQAGYLVGASPSFMEPSNELSFAFSDPINAPSHLPPAPCPSMDDLTADPNWLSDAELDKLLQSCVVPEASTDSGVAASWDVDQLLSSNLSLCV